MGVNNDIIKKKTHKNEKSMTLNRTLKRTLIYSMRSETGNQNIALFDLNWKLMDQWEVLEVLVLGSQINFNK